MTDGDTMTETQSRVAGEQGEVQVVQFRLGEEAYCISIGRVAELVHMDELTAIPNAAEHVEGVMDLRGVTTTIVDPKTVLDVDEEGERQRVVVLADEEGRQTDVGWVVDEVEEVLTVPESAIEDSASAREVQGVIKDEDRFTIWLDPEAINAGKTG